MIAPHSTVHSKELRRRASPLTRVRHRVKAIPPVNRATGMPEADKRYPRMGNRGCLLVVAMLAGSIFNIWIAMPAAAQSPAGLCEREMMRASSKYGVPLGMLYSVGL